MSIRFFCLSCAYSISASVIAFAQPPIETTKDAKKQIPTSKVATGNATDIAKKALAPAHGNDKNLEAMIQRARHVTKLNAQFLQDATNGKVLPFEALRKRYDNEFPLLLGSLEYDYKKTLDEKDPIVKKRLIQAFQKALFPIGAYLQTSPYANADMTLSKQQHAELVRLQKLDPRTQIGKKGLPELRAMSDRLTYTMLHLPVYMEVKAQPNDTVFFRSGGGGQFSNGLPLQEVRANKEGIASTTWISRGDSVGVSVITVTSPQSSSPEFFRVKVIALALNPLPKMPKLKQVPKELKNKLKALQEQHSSSPTSPLKHK